MSHARSLLVDLIELSRECVRAISGSVVFHSLTHYLAIFSPSTSIPNREQFILGEFIPLFLLPFLELTIFFNFRRSQELSECIFTFRSITSVLSTQPRTFFSSITGPSTEYVGSTQNRLFFKETFVRQLQERVRKKNVRQIQGKCLPQF